MILIKVILGQSASLHGVVHVSVCSNWPKHSNPALHVRDRFLVPTPHVPEQTDQADQSSKLSRIQTISFMTNILYIKMSQLICSENQLRGLNKSETLTLNVLKESYVRRHPSLVSTFFEENI